MTTKIKLINYDVLPDRFIHCLGYLIDIELSGVDAVALAETITILESKAIDVRNSKNALITKYGSPIKAEDGTVTGYTLEGITPKKLDKFSAEFNAVLKEEFEVPLTSVIVIPESTKITAYALTALKKIIKVG